MMANKLAAAIADDSSTESFYREICPQACGSCEKRVMNQKLVECISKHKNRHYPECTGQQRGLLVDCDRRGDMGTYSGVHFGHWRVGYAETKGSVSGVLGQYYRPLGAV